MRACRCRASSVTLCIVVQCTGIRTARWCPPSSSRCPVAAYHFYRIQHDLRVRRAVQQHGRKVSLLQPPTRLSTRWRSYLTEVRHRRGRCAVVRRARGCGYRAAWRVPSSSACPTRDTFQLRRDASICGAPCRIRIDSGSDPLAIVA